MGTSSSISTPSGGGWSQVKASITGHFSGNRPITSMKGLIADTLSAGGGFGIGGRAGASAGGGGGGGGNVATSAGRATSMLGGFGSAIAGADLDAGLEALGLSDLAGKPAVEVIAAIADRIAEGCEGVDGEVLRNALNDSLLEAACLENDLAYGDLDAGLQSFLQTNGIEGLLEVFLCRFSFDMIWANIESYVQLRSPDEESFQAFMGAIEGICRAEVRSQIDAEKNNGRFHQLDWFGRDGVRVGRQVVAAIQSRLETP